MTSRRAFLRSLVIAPAAVHVLPPAAPVRPTITIDLDTTAFCASLERMANAARQANDSLIAFQNAMLRDIQYCWGVPQEFWEDLHGMRDVTPLAASPALPYS
jgi:hypothetical protein